MFDLVSQVSQNRALSYPSEQTVKMKGYQNLAIICCQQLFK